MTLTSCAAFIREMEKINSTKIVIVTTPLREHPSTFPLPEVSQDNPAMEPLRKGR